jgi:membrane-bound lytic murein transglycosylase A
MTLKGQVLFNARLMGRLIPLVCVWSISATAGHLEGEGRSYNTPTYKVKTRQYPVFQDDLDFDGMELALDRQLRRFDQKGFSGTIRMGGVNYPLRRVKETLGSFLNLVRSTKRCLGKRPNAKQRAQCFRRFNNKIKTDYYVFAPRLGPEDPRFGDEETAFFTGYYTPLLKVSSVPTETYRYPIYTSPGYKGKNRGPTREAIDFMGALRGKGYELAYAADLYDLYLLHVEGGGRMQFVDGSNDSSVYLSYAGTNRRPWRFISIYMMDQGYIDNGSIAAQRKFLAQNQHKEREIYSTCPSYVFFKESLEPPLGSDSVSLTDRRSIATDDELYRFKGMLTFIQSRRVKEGQEYNNDIEDPNDIEFRSFGRFFLDQDTGGAIVGKARADIYFGEGKYAEFASANMTQTGNMYFLLLKESARHKH